MGRIDNYRNLTIDTELPLLLFWGEQRQFPILQKVSRRVLIIQTSSAESEQSFSASGNILTSKKCRMKGDLVDAIVIINSFLNSNR